MLNNLNCMYLILQYIFIDVLMFMDGDKNGELMEMGMGASSPCLFLHRYTYMDIDAQGSKFELPMINQQNCKIILVVDLV